MNPLEVNALGESSADDAESVNSDDVTVGADDEKQETVFDLNVFATELEQIDIPENDDAVNIYLNYDAAFLPSTATTNGRKWK